MLLNSSKMFKIQWKQYATDVQNNDRPQQDNV